MRIAFATVAVAAAIVSFKVGTATGTDAPFWSGPSRLASATRVNEAASSRTIPALSHSKAATLSPQVANDLLETYCKDCHNDQLLLGNQSFDGFDAGHAEKRVNQAERMIRKLRAEMMPLPGAPRPAGDTLQMLAETFEQQIDKASPKPNPGNRTFPRLNRAEYDAVMKDLLNVDFNSADYLPLDTKSANFDNIADVQSLSTTLLEAYLNAAAAVSRIAVGDRNSSVLMTTYVASPFESQHPWDHIEGAPFGTRGGLVETTNFPADGKYVITMNIEGGVGTKLEDIDVSVDGVRVALLPYEKRMNPTNGYADKPLGVDILHTDTLNLKSGQHKLSVAFVRRTEGPYEDLIRPHDWSFASSGNASTGTTTPPSVIEVTTGGPYKITGMTETPARKAVFSCHPTKGAAAERACAEQIITRLGTKAYRHSLTEKDKAGLMNFYQQGSAKGGFEEGVRMALQAMLANPNFVFRFEKMPANVKEGQDYQISDYDLASRLSFFIWGSMPDDTLLSLARQKRLSDSKVLAAQVSRMLVDPRSEALSTRFAAQWLRLQDVDKVHPDAFYFPNYDQGLADDMKKETLMFFDNLIKDNHSFLDLYTANYTFVNDRLARHYDIPNVSGPEFRKVNYPDANRRGLMGQGTMLVQTSLANRTSPVLRGKWVMEVLIGMPPPPPPPNVPTLDETQDGKDGKPLTTRERMEIHRKAVQCRTCHQYMDPIGLSLDNFDVTGRWRYREAGVPLDTRGNYYDQTPISTPSDLQTVLLKRPIPLVRNFTENLMAYATGRRMEDFDQPTIRAIARDAAANGYKMSSFITSVVNSPAFRSKRAEPVVADDKQSK